MKNRILLIGDTVSACRVALSAMEPVLTRKGQNVSTLPTAIVSNTFGYRKVSQLSTGSYVADSLQAWEAMDFDFDSIYVGYVTDRGQADAISEYCRIKSAQGKKIFLDPIMGEDCHLYYDMGESNAEFHRQIIAVSDYIMPSYTEAAFITGSDYTKTPASREAVCRTIDSLMNLGAKNVVITSCIIDGKDFTAGYDAGSGEYFFLECDHVPVKVAGTGDLFAAFFISGILSGNDIRSAARTAMDSVRELVVLNMHNADTLRGVEFDRYIAVK